MKTIPTILGAALLMLTITSTHAQSTFQESVLLNFNGTNGASPYDGLLQGSDGSFYGITYTGGASNGGTIFKLTSGGTLTTLVNLTGVNGYNNQGELIQGSDGNFYGTTPQGGSFNDGSVFQLTPSGTMTTLVNFNQTNGNAPFAGLVQGSDGNFYGTTQGGGPSSQGTIFKLTPAGVLTTLVNFNGTNGAFPDGSLIQGSDGNFYGTTQGGGGMNGGTAFRVTPGGSLTTLVSFNQAFSQTDGSYPDGGLIQGSDGNFYGTTVNGGTSNQGTIFQLTPGGTFTTLVSFAGTNGGYPEGGLVQGRDGNYYGTTSGGGSSNDGTVFQVTPNGTLTTVVNFAGANGANPLAGLIQGSDGNLYGTTQSGGSSNNGTVFKITVTTHPPPWQQGDIGATQLAGSAVVSGEGTNLTVTGNGDDIWNGADAFHYVYQSVTGDFTLVAQVNAQSNTNPWAKAGLMVRNDTTDGSVNALMAMTPGNGATFQYRQSASGSCAYANLTGKVAPQWLALTRQGNLILGYVSSDRVNWILVGSQTLSNLNANVLVGLAVTSHDVSTLSTGTFTNVNLAASSSKLTPPPAPWQESDIGIGPMTGVAGSAWSTNSGSTLTVAGSGNDIWNAADAFHYVYQSITGNFMLIEQVTSQVNTDAWAKAGLMLRNDTTSGSVNALVAVTPGNGMTFQYRTTASGNSSFTNISGMAPQWLKLVRVGSVITGYCSTDRVNWTQVGTATLNNLNPTVLVGLAVTSHNANELSTATFNYTELLPVPQSGSVYHLLCQANGMALDNGGSTSNGSAIIEWSDQSNNPNQEWKLVDVGGGYYNLINQTSGKALDNEGATSNGTGIWQWDSQAGNTNQKWQLVDAGNGYYNLICQTSGKAMDDWGVTSNGGAVRQYTQQVGNGNQEWRFEFIR